ncbi:TIGR03016 family PEP-CTERM system-associated outer membrane protein [Desulfovibrio psychrotolerans]|uniref:Porin n=1 Tax=Desulfovibrio psychrotolerans TaxID=415242 RepID=A0A7J0BUE1_9BACT|nr:TIGR03016 family PEP-CTERM system-associated outer membrane protein [Desulfovibrio psychrotolerans]GFM37329.1 hypothetical protein DSM19430T_20130 [Desulfovibrio psychrotolerans]
MSRLHLSVLVFLCLAVTGRYAFAGELRITPKMSAGTEYSDNVEERRNGKGDFILSATPGAEVTYDSSRLEFSAKGSMEFREYAKGVKDSETLGQLDARMKLEALKNFMFFEVSDSYAQVYSDAARGEVQEGDNSSGDVTDRNRFTFSPYVETDLLKRTRLKSGYQYDRYDYSADASTGKAIHMLFGNVEHELTDRWNAETRLSYAHHNPDKGDPWLDVYKLLLGTSYEYAEDSKVFLLAGPSHMIREGGGSSSDPSWEAGVKHALEKGMALSLTTSRDLEEDAESSTPRDRIRHTVRFDHELKRATWYAQVSYGDYENGNSAARTAVWSPGVGTTYQLTERLMLSGGLSSTMEDAPGDNTTRFYGNAGLRYQLSETFAGRLMYRYKLVDTGGSSDDYQVNRLGLYLDASF